MVFKKKKLSGIDTDTTFVADTHGERFDSYSEAPVHLINLYNWRKMSVVSD